MTKEQQEIFKINNKISTFKTDHETTTRIIKTLWDLNDEANKYFSELNLLLSINSIDENIKLKKGLRTVSKNLFEMSKKIYEYTEEKKDIIIECDKNDN